MPFPDSAVQKYPKLVVEIFFVYSQLDAKTVQLNVKTVLFQTIQFTISTQFSSI